MFIEYLITIMLSFIIAFAATPIAKRVAFGLKAVDIPTDDRRMHTRPIARMGGLAVICGFLVSVFFNVLNIKDFVLDRQLGGLLAGLVFILAGGVMDDIKPVSPKVKFLFQVLGATTAVLISGIIIERITNPFVILKYSEISPYVAYPLTILWIVGITNAVNFIDGLDGLATGVCTISCLSLFFISITRSDISPATALFTAVITASLAGSALGFLPFNFHPAKIILGETGAGFLGYVLGFISIQGTVKSYAAISIVVPLVILGIPVFDTAFAIFRRVANKKPISQGDRGHLHHRLIDLGMSHRQCVIFMYLGTGALGLSAIVLSSKGPVNALLLLLPVALFLIVGAKYMGGINHDDSEYTENENKENTGEAEGKSNA